VTIVIDARRRGDSHGSARACFDVRPVIHLYPVMEVNKLTAMLIYRDLRTDEHMPTDGQSIMVNKRLVRDEATACHACKCVLTMIWRERARG
jgi:hypothetical protein